MATAFWSAALGFHLAVGAVAVWLGRRWVVRMKKIRPTWLWLLQLAADATLLNFAALFAAVCASPFVYPSLFTPVRFVSQALFLEAPLLAGWVAFVHWRTKQRRRALLPAAVVILLLGVYFEAYHREPHDLQVRRYRLRIGHGDGSHHLRVAQFSDIQTNQIGPYERRVILEAGALMPDLIVFTGDYVQMRLEDDPGPAREAFRELLQNANLRPRCGAFAIDGDVEKNTDWRSLFAGTGVRCLDNSSVAIGLEDGETLILTGLNNRASRAQFPSDLAAILAQAPEGDLHVVMGHSPDYARALVPGQVDLALAGHTHGGQIVLPGIGPVATLSRLPHRYAGGLHDYHGTPLLVSRGIGMERRTAPQVRFFCPPELCVLDLQY
jgi:predicted MPP superfamily phosphohydrolase